MIKKLLSITTALGFVGVLASFLGAHTGVGIAGAVLSALALAGLFFSKDPSTLIVVDPKSPKETIKQDQREKDQKKAKASLQKEIENAEKELDNTDLPDRDAILDKLNRLRARRDMEN